MDNASNAPEVTALYVILHVLSSELIMYYSARYRWCRASRDCLMNTIIGNVKGSGQKSVDIKVSRTRLTAIYEIRFYTVASTDDPGLTTNERVGHRYDVNNVRSIDESPELRPKLVKRRKVHTWQEFL